MSTGNFPRVGIRGGELKAGNSNGLQLSLLDALKPDSEGTPKMETRSKLREARLRRKYRGREAHSGATWQSSLGSFGPQLDPER